MERGKEARKEGMDGWMDGQISEGENSRARVGCGHGRRGEDGQAADSVRQR